MNVKTSVCLHHLWPAAALLLPAHGAHAACAASGNPIISLSSNIYDRGRDAVAPGDALGFAWSSTDIAYTTDSCSAQTTRFVFRPNAPAIPGLAYLDGTEAVPVYVTDNDGIGYVIKMYASPLDKWFYVKPSETGTESWSANASVKARYAVLLVAAKRLEPGSYTIVPQTLGVGSAYSGSTLLASRLLQLDAATVIINGTSCRMTTPSEQAVILPTISQEALAAAGAIAGRGSSFHIGVDCDAGVALHVTLTDASDAANTGTTLSLAPGSTAKGVGVQVFYSDASAPVSYGPDSPLKGNLHQWKIGESGVAKSYDIPFTAAYVRNGAVTPGSVLAKATFTFSYQ